MTVRVPDSSWTGPFSRRHPRTVIEVLGRNETGRREVVADHWISGRPAGVWAREIASYPDVLKVESLAEVGDGSLYRVKFRAPAVVELYRRLEMPLPFPIRLQGGQVRWEVVARQAQVEALLRLARGLDPEARVAWTRTPPLRAHLPLLSPSQRALLDRAIEAGYFAAADHLDGAGPRVPPQQGGGLSGPRPGREEALGKRCSGAASLSEPGVRGGPSAGSSSGTTPQRRSLSSERIEGPEREGVHSTITDPRDWPRVALTVFPPGAMGGRGLICPREPPAGGRAGRSAVTAPAASPLPAGNRRRRVGG